MSNRPVIIYAWDIKSKPINGSFQKIQIGIGEFHGWGCNYEEFESGAGNYSTAIIELTNGSVTNIEVDLIKFNDIK